MLRRFDAVQEIMLPSLREERAATYSPFLPIHPRTRVVMQVPLLGIDAEAGTIRWRDPDTGEEFETPVTGGHCKLQWKPDWAMRWYALNVDYEMAGKDLINSVKLSSQIVRALGAEPPAGFNYELFLDEKGQKISKSKGNGLTIDEWLTYASPESLSLFMFQKPMAAKRLYFDVDPAHRRRLPRLSRRLSAAGMEGAARQSRLARPFRRAAGARDARARAGGADLGLLRHAAQSRRRRQQRQSGGAVGLPAPLRALGDRRKPIRGSTGWSITPSPISAISSRRRSAIARPTRSSAPRSRRCRRNSAALPAQASAEEIQHALYDIARPIPRYQDMRAKGATPERPGVSNEFFNMIYAVLLGEERGPAPRLVHRALRRRGDARADRQGAGGGAGSGGVRGFPFSRTAGDGGAIGWRKTPVLTDGLWRLMRARTSRPASNRPSSPRNFPRRFVKPCQVLSTMRLTLSLAISMAYSMNA